VSSKVSTTQPLYCGELARLSGVSADTVRFYERRNLLFPAARTSAGYRVFSPDSIARMRLIRAGLSIGFSVTELADIFHERSGGGAPCRRVRKLAAEKLAVLEKRLREFQIVATRITFDAFRMGPDASQNTSRQTGSTAGKVGNSPEDPDTIFGSRHSKTGRAMN